eukprot:6096851-Alexandrium_andersonii.AAC.1
MADTTKTNRAVQLSVANGLHHVKIYSRRISPGCVMFLKDVGNMFNDQATSVTFLEKFRATSNVEQAWGRKKQLMQWAINRLGQATYDAKKF